MTIQERIQQVDAVMEKTAFSVAQLSELELRLAQGICEHFELPLGSLLRRAAAIELVGASEDRPERLREAAQHLVYR